MRGWKDIEGGLYRYSANITELAKKISKQRETKNFSALSVKQVTDCK